MSTASTSPAYVDNNEGVSEGVSEASTVNSSSEDVVSISEPQEHLESNYVEEEDDPLGVKKLALSFDYLLYKISEKMEGLAQQTEASVISRKEEADRELVDVESSMGYLKALIQKCDELDNDFSKIEQISVIVGDFKERIKDLEPKIKTDDKIYKS